MARKKPLHYVNNEELLEALVLHKKNVKANKIKPVIPNYIASCILKMADGLAQKSKFCNYPFVEEMKADGVKNCIEYLDNFNPEKSKNPFGYFTQIIYYAFIRRIDKEKKYLYTKFKVIDNANLFEATSGRHEYDSYDASYNDFIKQSGHTIEYMTEFVQNYEHRKFNKNANTESSAGDRGLDQQASEPEPDTGT